MIICTTFAPVNGVGRISSTLNLPEKIHGGRSRNHQGTLRLQGKTHWIMADYPEACSFSWQVKSYFDTAPGRALKGLCPPGFTRRAHTIGKESPSASTLLVNREVRDA
jgi:hypothetical protein